MERLKRAKKSRPSRVLPPWNRALSVFVATLVMGWIRTLYRVQIWGHLPKDRGATLVVGNHGHNLEGMVFPAHLLLSGGTDHPVYSAGSVRIFEPGFLATRMPLLLSWALTRVDIGPVVSALGVLPIENQPRVRPLLSFAQAVMEAHGSIPLEEAFSSKTLKAVSLRAGREISRERLGRLFSSGLRPAASMEISLHEVLDPYRTELRQGLRKEIEGQLSELATALHRGGTIYLTPEGRMTPDGTMARFRHALEHLLPLAADLYIGASAYDALGPGRLAMFVRILRPADPGDLRTSLAAARPVTPSQLVATVLVDQTAPVSEERLSEAALTLMDELPPSAFVVPTLQKDAPEAVAATITAMKRRYQILGTDEGYLYQPAMGDIRFPEVPDMVVYQARSFQETREALLRLGEKAQREGETVASVLPP